MSKLLSFIFYLFFLYQTKALTPRSRMLCLAYFMHACTIEYICGPPLTVLTPQTHQITRRIYKPQISEFKAPRTVTSSIMLYLQSEVSYNRHAETVQFKFTSAPHPGATKSAPHYYHCSNHVPNAVSLASSAVCHT